MAYNCSEDRPTAKPSTAAGRAAALAVALVLCAGVGLAAEPAARPNIIVIIADDLGSADLGSRGTADIRTPHIDRLVREGITFRNFYANSSVCSPTRAALLTGRYPDRVGVPGVIRDEVPGNSWGFLSPHAVLLPQRLATVGYHSAAIGKWHLGTAAPNRPNDRGFDFFHGFLGDMMDDYWSHRRNDRNFMRRNHEEIDPPGHATDLFTQWACDYLAERAKSDRPFFLYLAYNAPHGPIQPPPDWLEKVRKRQPGLDPVRAAFVALTEHMDAGIGRVLDTLDRTGLADGTLLFFTSDNGGSLHEGGTNLPWRGGKGEMYEGGLRVPAVVRWPGRIAAGAKTDHMAVSMDFFATACEAAGAPCVAAGSAGPSAVDAVSFLPTLLGATQPSARSDTYFVRREGNIAFMGKTSEAVIRGEWKLVLNGPFQPPELYHVQRDPGERENLAEKETKILTELGMLLRGHVQRGGEVPWQRMP